MYYKLIDPFDTEVRVYLPHKQGSGVKSEPFLLKPNKKYEEYVDDEIFMDALLAETKEITYSKEREDALRKYGAKFDVKICKVCGGRKKKLVVHFAEVVNETD